MSDTKLGTLLDETAVRDAIHVACAPVVAAHRLSPGTHVQLTPDGRAAAGPNPIGIVDPFLTTVVKPGERFWLILYQKTVTGMRHSWFHPAFKDEALPAATNTPRYNLAEGLAHVNTQSKSEIWMRKWAMDHMSQDHYGDYEKPLAEDVAYGYAIQAGHDNNVGPYESARDHMHGEWWDHWEKITGSKGDRESGFSCAC